VLLNKSCWSIELMQWINIKKSIAYSGHRLKWNSLCETPLLKRLWCLTFSEYYVFGQNVATAGDRRLDTQRSNTWPVQSINSKTVVCNMWCMYHKRISMQLLHFTKPQMNLTYREIVMFRKVRDKKIMASLYICPVPNE